MNDPLWRYVEDACRDIPVRLGTRRARAVGARLYRLLKARIGAGDARALAEAITGAEIERLSPREAIHALRAHGIPLRDNKLPYRLKERYHLSVGATEFVLDRRGRCSIASRDGLRRPIAKLILHIDGRNRLSCIVEPFERVQPPPPISRTPSDETRANLSA
jgi:hypothetical protein